ncbi:hypothetical protein [Microbacterium sp. gxy059]|uniref:hypothetical protein n=1 Tax=Microbacterium sp. gxy059 TaxID=2957199 RepID=UPI003D993BC0
MSTLELLGRALADSADRDSWLAQHDRVIGSSTAGKFARPSSVETYVRQILAPKTFTGSAATESGNRWEPILLAWAGAEPNSLLIHHPDEKRFGATIDGTIPTSTGFAICETKTKHKRVVTSPTPYEVRQLAWQLYCLPEAEFAAWVWGELVEDPTEPEGWRLRRDPQTLIFHRDDPKIVAATELIVPIAHDVLAALDAATSQEVSF